MIEFYLQQNNFDRLLSYNCHLEMCAKAGAKTVLAVPALQNEIFATLKMDEVIRRGDFRAFCESGKQRNRRCYSMHLVGSMCMELQ